MVSRLRLFNAYVSSVFLYNSEVWTLDKKEKEIDIFQRKLLKMVLNIRYPYIISNEKLYEKTKEMEWSKKIKLRRFRLLGHVLRLPHNAPVKLSLQESQRRSKSQRQGNRNSWIKQVNKDLSEIDRGWNLGSGEIELLAEDREMWDRSVVKVSLRRL